MMYTLLSLADNKAHILLCLLTCLQSNSLHPYPAGKHCKNLKKKKPSKLRVVMWNVINARIANNWGRSFLYELAKEGLSEEERDLS